jgi:diguanylate cyclase (GGDEF)-like protein
MFAWAMAIAFVVPALVAPVATALVTRLGDALADAHDRLHALAHVDGLTGAATRRAFFTEAEATLRNRRGPGVVVVGMVDADAFKSLNDSCGHAAGDRALVDLATAVRGWLGDDGVLGRLGGDEFAFVRRLPAHMADDELAALEQRCRRLGSVGDRTVTASVGAVEAEDREDLHDALARADRALYEAKRRRATAARARPATPYRRASRNMALTES